MHKIWESTLGEEYTEDVRQAWDLIFDYIFRMLSNGFHLYTMEKENQAKASNQMQQTEVSTCDVLEDCTVVYDEIEDIT